MLAEFEVLGCLLVVIAKLHRLFDLEYDLRVLVVEMCRLRDKSVKLSCLAAMHQILVICSRHSFCLISFTFFDVLVDDLR